MIQRFLDPSEYPPMRNGNASLNAEDDPDANRVCATSCGHTFYRRCLARCRDHICMSDYPNSFLNRNCTLMAFINKSFLQDLLKLT